MKTKDMLYIAMFTAVVAVLGLIPTIYLPFTPVPITAQTFGVMLAGGILGARLGGLSLTLFLLIAAIGAPIIAGGRGGIPAFVAPNGGFLISFPFAALIIGYLVEKFWHNLKVWKVFLINIFGGVLVVYAFGIPYMVMMTDMSIAVAAGFSMVYLPGDFIKAIVAAYIVVRIKKAYPIIKGKPIDHSKSM